MSEAVRSSNLALLTPLDFWSLLDHDKQSQQLSVRHFIHHASAVVFTGIQLDLFATSTPAIVGKAMEKERRK